MKDKNLFDWFFRFIKGMFIGTGAILPGVSGGALAAVFGIYERMISFIANITKDFKKNFFYFLPVGIGGVMGVFLLSFALSYFFEKAETQIIWFFIGCIIGILPALFKQATKKGKTSKHTMILIITAVLATTFLMIVERSLIGQSIPLNFFTWIMAGAIFGLGLIVPGLSPSNFLVFLGMYQPMTDGIKNLDWSVIIPMAIGGIAIIVLLSKLVNYIFKVAYAGLYHFIIGVVFASTIMIIPTDYNYLSSGGFVCLVACIIGIVLGLWMNKLEETYKPE